ncbi:ATP-binding protein involved in chromosome partitioning [Verrucomicrobium sp. GAS474]|uniref:Mrp/NBP35 family ATP-binding protein n=1 Tax=Verrucomicrobium sp. GAS474 TaxID=1882831 RepID=UPI00087CFB89|nr:Mrp/NBP35 family ATP-binding protein [Verrucomicrobium sp. GAS474]SDU27958.1 ATP-binding protein involved in chromosome partitioning [Verrucomicrobium sp. GAS474]
MNSPLREDQIIAALKTVKYPGFSRDIVSFGLVKGTAIAPIGTGDRQKITLRLALATADKELPRQIDLAVRDALHTLLPGGADLEIEVEIAVAAPPAAAPHAHAQAPGATGPVSYKTEIPGVRHIVAVASGKGGVGKSTVAANLAVALRQAGWRVGLCDCDIYGPSIAHMFGTREAPVAEDETRILPIERHGLRLMSMGFLLEGDAPAVLRGPMVTRYTQQFLRNVAWGELDILLLDLPPGTGDIQLTIVQTVALSGAIIVTTPQEVALIDARKAASMFQKVNVPLLGLIENMSAFLCPDNGKRYAIFGSDGGKHEAARLGVPLLGEIPIEIALRESGDAGVPLSLHSPESATAQAFLAAATAIQKRLG